MPTIRTLGVAKRLDPGGDQRIRLLVLLPAAHAQDALEAVGVEALDDLGRDPLGASGQAELVDQVTTRSFRPLSSRAPI